MEISLKYALEIATHIFPNSNEVFLILFLFSTLSNCQVKQHFPNKMLYANYKLVYITDLFYLFLFEFFQAEGKVSLT